MLLRVCPPDYPAGEVNLRACGNKVSEPSGSGMLFWEDKKRLIIEPYEIEEIQCRPYHPPLRCRDGDDIIRHDTLDILVIEGIDDEGEPPPCPGNDKKRSMSSDEDRTITWCQDHASVRFSDWQVGQMGCFPTALKVALQSRQR